MPDAVEPTTGCRDAGVPGDDAATGTIPTDTGEIAVVGTAAPVTGPPWLGITVITAAAAAARPRSVIVPVIIPARKLTSSSRALMAARMPRPDPVIR